MEGDMSEEKLEIIYREPDIEKFRRDILAGNLCDIFLPVSFIEADGFVGAVYITTGYQRYSTIRQARASMLIGTVTSLIDKMRQAERRYFFEGEYSLDPECIFINDRIPDASLIYRKTKPMTKAGILTSFKKILTPGPVTTVKGEDFIRKALYTMNDPYRNMDVIRHDLMAIGTEAFRAEC